MTSTAITTYLAHGASGSGASMRPHVDGLARRGLAARAVELPVRRADRAIEAYRAQIAGTLTNAVIGGHSFGGRVASLLAADETPRGLVLLSYPLHRPGHAEEQRTEHWPRIECPVLLLSGESDPFARIDLLRRAAQQLAGGELVTYPRLGHGLAPVLEGVLDRIAEFVTRVSAGSG
jgi:hypothetical protein